MWHHQQAQKQEDCLTLAHILQTVVVIREQFFPLFSILPSVFLLNIFIEHPSRNFGLPFDLEIRRFYTDHNHIIIITIIEKYGRLEHLAFTYYLIYCLLYFGFCAGVFTFRSCSIVTSLEILKYFQVPSNFFVYKTRVYCIVYRFKNWH